MRRKKNSLNHRQQFGNGEVHSWYNFIWGYSDKFVQDTLSRFPLKAGEWVLDPFCGNATTLVECTKAGVNSIGIDANPFSCFVSKVKSNTQVSPVLLAKDYASTLEIFQRLSASNSAYKDDPTYEYLLSSGMLERGWISTAPLKDAIRFKQAIHEAATSPKTRNILLVIFASLIATKIGNMRYGPEIYRGRPKKKADFLPEYRSRVRQVLADISLMTTLKPVRSRVYQHDSRKLKTLWERHNLPKPKLIITSPPYPTEHDYTRNTRLELAFLNLISTSDCVRDIKKSMVRSHTKGVYKSDLDGDLVSDSSSVQRLVNKVRKAGVGKTSGFARLYPWLVELYFGGMKRHLSEAYEILPRKGIYVMLVGDQSSYHGVKITTGTVLGKIAKEIGFDVVSSTIWRQRWSTVNSRNVAERIITLRKP